MSKDQYLIKLPLFVACNVEHCLRCSEENQCDECDEKTPIFENGECVEDGEKNLRLSTEL